MAIIPFPSCPPLGPVRWLREDPTQVNESEWTGRRKATILSAKPRWTPEVRAIEIADEETVWPWRAFFALVNGQANTFRLPAVRKPQITGVSPKVRALQQAGYTTDSNGWGAAGLKLRAGQFVTINDQLLTLTADVIADGTGSAVLNFRPYIRTFPVENTPIIADIPTCLVSLSADVTGWDDEEDGFYTIPAFACREAF